mgnify:CR=1 FL=1
MKKRIIAWAVLLSVCAAALGLWCSAAAGKAARTLPCEEEGLILSITTFDGKSESKPFLKCFRHTWIGLDNRTGHTVYLKDRAIPDGEMVTFSVWAVSGLSGLLFDLEPCYKLRPLHRQTVPEHQYRGGAAEGHRGLHGTAR